MAPLGPASGVGEVNEKRVVLETVLFGLSGGIVLAMISMQLVYEYNYIVTYEIVDVRMG
jgi:hypothetical protein